VGVAGLGTTPHFLGWSLAQKAGISLEAIPYKGTPQMAQEVAAGQLACAISPQANFAELIKGGKLRLLATTGTQRSSVFPQVPTFTEAGVPELQSEEWFALIARAGTPQPLLDALGEATRKAGQHPAYRKALSDMGFAPETRDATRLARDIRADFERWAEVVRKTGFKAEA
jgi:tripartite-type tricarboxylate transporter receptor subunit TctC